MKLSLSLFLQSFFVCLTIETLVSGDSTDSSCDIYGILIYEDFGCKAEYDNASKCPSRFSCKGLEPSKSQCYFRGKSYQDREHVNSSLTNPSCDEGCFCNTNENRSSFTCAILDCPEWLGVPVKFGCYRNYSLDHCCSVGEICPPFDEDTKCVVNGKEFKEGDKFYPDNTCFDCVCRKGFNGKFEEPFCRRRWCGQQLRQTGTHIQDSCAPYYRVETEGDHVVCCPDDWICPEGSEVITGDVKSERSCKFGVQVVKVGQTFEKKNFTDKYGRHTDKVKCECVIPPLVKCTGT
ncbi:uncharacterized protein LOC123013070 [Tribolium madens]|uniref:uncharacterized protein LOC123013070 n=1 Tax=Tribolium madens TaxID=41895 RepID=UPI001CF74651|nr:uncharacterized protein LOC123013070 [Tribolium madens]